MIDILLKSLYQGSNLRCVFPASRTQYGRQEMGGSTLAVFNGKDYSYHTQAKDGQRTWAISII